MKRYGRKQPYTDAGIKRLPCFRCGAPACHQWQVCADDNLWRPLCRACDVALNGIVLEWMSHPERERLMAAYGA